MYNFLITEAKDLIPAQVFTELQEVNSYNISVDAKMKEPEAAMANWLLSLKESERLEMEKVLNSRIRDYLDKHFRELRQIEIVKIDLKDLKVLATGVVSGWPLNNQFPLLSLDEHEGNLRIVTMFDEINYGGNKNIYEVNVLDSNLKPLSSIQDLGQSKLITSVKFIDNYGYVLFNDKSYLGNDLVYLIDSSNPKRIELKGELNIPGYSSLIHPISENIILAISRTIFEVKLSLIDISDTSNPKEIFKYSLEDEWFNVADVYQAFLLDNKHQAFFFPGYLDGYIFTYTDNKLQLKKVIDDILVKQAIYLGDYMYIVDHVKSLF